MPKPTLSSAIGNFGSRAKQKFASMTTRGQPEDQLRAPFEQLLVDVAELLKIQSKHITAIGEVDVRNPIRFT
jgi:hypothetical protein